jgi:RNA polymerase sigma-70 factor (ECF subfamily)
VWPDSEETRQLLEQARNSRPEAVELLLDRHRAALRRMVQLRLDRALQGRVDASDVIQDVLLEASRRLAEYLRDAKLPFHLWLRQLAKDRIVDMHRRHRSAQRRSVDRERRLSGRVHPEHSSLDLAAALRDPELTPAAASIRRELEHRFLQALDELSDDERDVILMRHFEQLGNSEVAEALGITQAAAGMRHLRALRRLRELLTDLPSND